MRIKNSSQTSRANLKANVARSSANAPIFKPNMGQETMRVAPSGTSNPVAPVNSLLALQGIEDPLFAKKKNAKRGQSILDILEEMKIDILSGKISEGKLNRLLALIGQAKIKSEPALDSLIEDIELRARVELAKLGHFPN